MKHRKDKHKNKERRRSLNGGGIGSGDHFLPYKLIKRTFER